MAERIFLAVNALIWLPYGLACLLDPGSLAEAAGVGALSATGTTELRAMYGGLQGAIGVWAGFACWRPSAALPVLTALLVLPAGLFVTRLGGALVDDAFTGYTLGALGLEAGIAGVAALLLRRRGA